MIEINTEERKKKKEVLSMYTFVLSVAVSMRTFISMAKEEKQYTMKDSPHLN